MRDLNLRRFPLLTKGCWFIVWTLPALWTGWLIHQNGVDVPHWDQWSGFAPLLEKAESGELRLGDFFALHNEHRHFFPRLLMFAVAKLTHWNVRAELLVLWLLGWVCALGVAGIASATGFPPFRYRWSLLAANVLVFTPLGWENWLWGFQIGFLLPAAAVALGIWSAVAPRFPLNFVAAIALCTVCTFSFASGFTYWLLIFPLLLLPEGRLRWRDRKPWLLAGVLAFLLTTFMYLYGYEKPHRHPSTAMIFLLPLDALRSVFAYLGAPFAHGTLIEPLSIAQTAGILVASVLVFVTAYLWRHRQDSALIARALPWIAFTGVAIVNAMLVTIGRLGFGVFDTALPSRYMPFSTTLPIGLLFLVPLVFGHWRDRNPQNTRILPVGMAISSLASALALLHLIGAVSSTNLWIETKYSRLYTKSVVLCAGILDDPETLKSTIHTDTEPLRRLILMLDRLQYLRPGLLRSKSIREIASQSAPQVNEFGEIQRAGAPAKGQYHLAGWAILPDKLRPADAVLLTYDEPGDGEPQIFAMTRASLPSPLVAERLQQPMFSSCGWSKAFDLALLPDGARTIRAWAFDAELARAYPLKGAANLPN